jgi:transcriptional regulator of acetoin/glycerol metabolism
MACAPPSRSAARGRPADPAMVPVPALLPLGAQHLARIEQSHQRCAAIGLSRIGRPEHEPLPRADLDTVLGRHRRLFNHAVPVMELLHEQIVDSHSMVVLCDAAGTIIHSIGDPDFLARASQVALQPGVNWSEPAKGTNAIGTALMDEAPTLVHAQEHFMHANHFLTCSAVPIFGPRGDVLGVLDVTGDHRSYHPHTMALVKLSARMIENHWLSDELGHQLCLHFHARPECLGTLMDGILVATPEGRIVGANRNALALLQLSDAAVRTQSLDSLLGLTVAGLLAHARAASPPPLRTVLPDGRVLYARARFGWRTWRRAGGPEEAVPTPASAPAPSAGGSCAAPAPAPPATQAAPPLAGASAVGAGPALQAPCATTLKALEIETIRQTVDALDGNIAAAARRLGISRNTIYRKLRWQARA